MEPGSHRDLADDIARAALTMAERLAAGATLWSFAPTNPEHARHLAVEFVHPVIVGKRALPAVSIDGPGSTATLRSMIRRGDIVVAVGEVTDEVRDALGRCSAWGALSIWIDDGEPTDEHLADHRISVGGTSECAVYDGTLVRAYHLLWELTHVCLESDATFDASPAVGEACITCSDGASVGEVISTGGDGMALVRVDGEVVSVDVSLVTPPAPFDLVLVHAGAAISAVDTTRA